MIYNVAVRITKQEDGLFRAECPDLQGCFVDNATLEGALTDIQDAAQVWIESQKAMGGPLPKQLALSSASPTTIMSVCTR